MESSNDNMEQPPENLRHPGSSSSEVGDDIMDHPPTTLSPSEPVQRLQRSIELFNNLVDERIGELQSVVRNLDEIGDDFESVHRSNIIGSLSGSVIVYAGSVLTLIVVLGWYFFISKVDMIVMVVVICSMLGISLFGAVTVNIFIIKRVENQFDVENKIKKLETEFQTLFGPIEQNLTEIYEGAERLRNGSRPGTHVTEVLRCFSRLPRPMHGIRDVAQLADLAKMPRGLCNRVKLARSRMEDMCFICNEAKEFNEMGSERRAQSKSDALKLIEAIKDTARSFQQAVDELRQCRNAFG